MLLPLFLLTMAPTAPVLSVRTLHLKNVSPTRIAQQLVDPAGRHPLTGELERLTPDDTRNTLTLVGTVDAVKTVEQVVRWLDIRKPQFELEVEVMGVPQTPLKGKVLIAQNERGTLTLFGKNNRMQFQFVPHLNRDGTCSVLIISEQEVVVPTTPEGLHRSGTTAFVRLGLGKSVALATTIGLAVENSMTYFPVRITPRLKK